MDVILFGATGMVGQGVLRECLLDPGVGRVLAIGRSASGKADPKLRGTCPTYSAGMGNTVTFSAGGGSIQAQVWAGSPTTGGGPIILYWNGTASSPGGEIPIDFDVNAITSRFRRRARTATHHPTEAVAQQR